MRFYLFLLPLTILFALVAVTSASLKTCVDVYIVERGDTLNKIANKFGVTLDQLKRANPCITNPDLIFTGCIIRIPNRTNCH
jgi:LysM repeat protein